MAMASDSSSQSNDNLRVTKKRRRRFYGARRFKMPNKKHFHKIYRMDPESFQNLHEELHPLLVHTKRKGIHLSTVQMLLLFLHYIASNMTFTNLATFHNISESCVLYTIRRVCNVIHALRNRFIKWPNASLARQNSMSLITFGIRMSF